MFKRAFILFSGTVTGLVGVLSYNPPHLAGAMTAPLSPTESTASAVTQPAAQPIQKSSTQAAKQSSDTSVKRSQKSSASKASQQGTPKNPVAPRAEGAQQQSGVSGTFQGDTSYTRYGPVQVQITVSNGEITNAEALAFPTRDRRSVQISQAVIPWLAQETVRIQSASVMAVSGATITTNAWNDSLASALQKAGK